MTKSKKEEEKELKKEQKELNEANKAIDDLVKRAKEKDALISDTKSNKNAK
jgi:hypothetical protein